MNKKKFNKNSIKHKSLTLQNEHSKPNFIPYLVILICSFILYGNTIFNDYALDDAIVITQNIYTQKGLKGIPEILSNEFFTGFFKVRKDLVTGGRYRPFSMITFAIEYEFFGKNPHISHFINVLLFAILCIFIYKTMEKLLYRYNYQKKWYWSMSFITTIIYLAHPIHTEAVANIKGRDEILSMLGSMMSFYYLIRFTENKNNKYLIYIFLSYIMAMFSKEIAITFFATIPLGMWFFLKERLKLTIKPFMTMAAAAIIYFIARHEVLSAPSIKTMPELLNDSFLEMNTSQKYATITYTLGLYIKLLFIPHPLTYDYYPYHIPIMEWSNWQVIISLLTILFLGFISIIKFKQQNILSYGILFYAISLAPVSNIFFPVGTFMNERFVFVASLGFCMIMAYFFSEYLPLKVNKKIIIALFSILILLYSIKTFTRNFDWKNDFTLFTHDVKISVNGAKSNCSAGGKLLEEAQKPENAAKREEYLKLSLKYLNHALKIYPRYIDALLLLGNAYFEYNKNYDSTIWAYLQILKINPEYDLVYSNLDIIFRNLDSVDYKIKVYEEIFKINPNRFEVNYQLGNLYGRYKNDLKKAKYFLHRAEKIKPNDPSVLKDLGVAYGFSQQFDSSLMYLLKSLQYEDKDPQTYMNIAVTYINLKDIANAIKYYNIAVSKDPKIKSEYFESLKMNYEKKLKK
ncbi:MAG: hypothetical protein N3A01_06940 [Bacteroidales bacterium]|nr:hypothetical protein [Bacteroidales bacterium]